MRALDKKTGSSSKPPKKELKKRPDLLIPSFTPEDLVRQGKQYAGLESPIDISFSILTDASLRPLEWVNFEKNPKRMKISNSGTTAILSAKWHGPRPYLTKGPLSGYYVFSQLHFHWGSSFEEGSEHTMDGKSLPLEVHVMFFKNTYMTQEDAMKQTDGTVTVSYLFTLQGNDNEDFNPIITALKEIQKPLTSFHLELQPLEKFLHIFTDDYFMYWGNVVNRSILWLICRKPLGISSRQLSIFHSMTGVNEKPITKNFRGTKELNHRTVYHINASKYRSDLLISSQKEPLRYSQNKKNRAGGQGVVQNALGDGKSKNDDTSRDGSSEKISEDKQQEAININIAINADEKFEYIVSQATSDSAEESSLNKSASNNGPLSLEKRRKSQIKFQLASALLNLEKEEGNDIDFLEKYLQTKFDTAQYEQCYQKPIVGEKQDEEMLLPSVRSLQMNSFEDIEASSGSPIKDNKSKSDTHCFKTFANSGADIDSEKLSIGGYNKSEWSSMNSISEKDLTGELAEDKSTNGRPKSCAPTFEESCNKLIENGEEKVLQLRSSSKLSNVTTPPSRTASINRAVLISHPGSAVEQEKTRKGILRETSYSKSRESAVDEARSKIRMTLQESLSKLEKSRGSTPKDSSRNRKGDSKTRPAWRY